MPDNNNGANGAGGSLPANSDEQFPSGKGDSPQKTSEQLLNEYKAENQRKQKEISELKAQHTKFEAELLVLQEKEKQRELTAKESSRKGNLEDWVTENAKSLREATESLPWIQIAKEEAQSEAQEIAINNEIIRGNEWLEDTAEFRGEKQDEFVKKLMPFTQEFNHLLPLRRNQKAYVKLQKYEAEQKDLQAREAKLKEFEAREQSFREGRGSIPRTPTRNDKFEQADPDEKAQMAVDLIGSFNTGGR